MRAPEQGNHIQEDFNVQPVAARCAATRDILVDFELMGWGSHMVGNPWSNADSVALLLRKCVHAQDDASFVDGSGFFHKNMPFMHG